MFDYRPGDDVLIALTGGTWMSTTVIKVVGTRVVCDFGRRSTTVESDYIQPTVHSKIKRSMEKRHARNRM